MKTVVLASCVALLAGVHVAHALETPGDANRRGYRECDLKHLSSCQNTNQLIFGLGKAGFRSPSYRKADFDGALKQFLRGAPRVHVLKYSWSAAESARDALTGPDGPPTRLSSGEWLFYGFTPHDAPDCAAIIFDQNGAILLVAHLSVAEGSSTQLDTSRHVLTVYVHRPEPSPLLFQRLRDWAKKTVAGMYTYPGFPTKVFVGTRVLTEDASGGRWEVRWLDR